jgi:hypothetical protein
MQAKALIPLEGLILGNVKDIQQYDPLQGVFSRYTMVDPDKMDEQELKRLQEYVGLFRQGANLKFACEYRDYYTYATQWDEANARRSIAATLQYVGLDISMRAIIEYSKKLELSEDEFKNIVDNLLENTCSKNISVYSIRLLRNNFFHLYNTSTNFQLPSIKNSPYFPENVKKLTNSIQAKENEMNLTLKNFRAFCSWGGDTDDYRLMAPYVSNPFIMSLVFNHLLRRNILWDTQMRTLTFEDNEDSVQVACEDLICRNKDEVRFNRLFPRMVGTTDLYGDLETLYCGHFRNESYRPGNPVDKINKWVKAQTIEDPYLEVLQFLSLYTGIPDALISSVKYKDLIKSLRESFDLRWQKWASLKTNQFVSDLLYEESLHIDLVPMAKSIEIKKGDFQLVFDYTLGELDRVLDVNDKIHSTFHLEFPRSYLKWLRRSFILANNVSDFTKMNSLMEKVTTYINFQLEAKKKLFLIPMWNEKMGTILAREMVSQLTSYKGMYFNDFGHEKMKIPVKFRYGLFALQYLRNRFKEKYRTTPLTFNQ